MYVIIFIMSVSDLKITLAPIDVLNVANKIKNVKNAFFHKE
jgi:hypothetical protein